jgi:putative DNA primase/helicase
MSKKQGADDFVARHGIAALDKLPSKPANEADPPEARRTDVGNAERLARRAIGKHLFVPEWNDWVVWDGRRWARDRASRIRELAVEVARDILLEARHERDPDEQEKLVKHALRSQTADRIAAMVKLTPDVMPDLKVTLERFDRNPWLLNVENGTIDLQTGRLRPHSQDDYITRLAPVTYEPKHTSKLWERTLAECLPDQSVRDFLQRCIGYALTGSVEEHKLFFAQGPGRNGKGLILHAIREMMGDYAGAAPEKLLVAR